MDMDTTTYKHSHEDILNTFKDKNINILIGTQMIAKGHDFPNVTLVGVLAADSLLNCGEYMAPERTFQLLTQVAGRAGRGDKAGRVLIQSYKTEDYSLVSACKHDYKGFFSKDIMIREKLNYPPFTNLAVIIFSGINDKIVYNISNIIKKDLTNCFNNSKNAIILGPARSPLTKIKNKFRWRIIIKETDIDNLLDVLSKISDEFFSKNYSKYVELGIDINPTSLF